MKTWRQMESWWTWAGAPHRHLEHDHPQAEAAAARRAHQAGGERDGVASALPAAGVVRSSCARTASSPSATARFGSPGRPERDRTPEDTAPTEDPVIVEDRRTPWRASGGGLHQVGRAARADADSVFGQSAQLRWPTCRAWSAIRSRTRRDAGDRRHRPQLPPHQGAGLSVERRTRPGKISGI
jgi:hypothetical protein